MLVSQGIPVLYGKEFWRLKCPFLYKTTRANIPQLIMKSFNLVAVFLILKLFALLLLWSTTEKYRLSFPMSEGYTRQVVANSAIYKITKRDKEQEFVLDTVQR